MFTEEEQKPGDGNPAPASGENPAEIQGQDEGKKPDQGGGSADQSAELEALKSQVSELQGLTEKQKVQLEQAGFNIQKYKEKLKEAGIELDEDGKGISEEKVQEIIARAQTPLLEEIRKMGSTMAELARAQVKPNANPGGGGQKPPIAPKEPDLPPELKETIKNLGLQWTGKGKVYKSPKTGRMYDYDKPPGSADINY